MVVLAYVHLLAVLHLLQVSYLACQALEQLLLDSKQLDGVRQVRC